MSAQSLRGDLKVVVESPQTTDAPIILRLTVANSGEGPIYFEDAYPDARRFTAVVTDADHKVVEMQLSNGTALTGGGTPGKRRSILPGASQDVPAVLDPLQAGEYTIAVRCDALTMQQAGRAVEAWPAMQTGQAAHLVVRDDKQARDAFISQFRERAAQRERFAKYVLTAYGYTEEDQALVKDLQSDDDDATRRAALQLAKLRRLPSGGSDALLVAVRKRSIAPAGFTDVELTGALVELAAAQESHLGVEVELLLAHKLPNGSSRRRAINALSRFSLEEARQGLTNLLKDHDELVQGWAAEALAARRDPAAIEPLVRRLLSDTDVDARVMAARSLKAFVGHPGVRDALERALADKSPTVRERAKEALDIAPQ